MYLSGESLAIFSKLIVVRLPLTERPLERPDASAKGRSCFVCLLFAMSYNIEQLSDNLERCSIPFDVGSSPIFVTAFLSRQA